MTRSPRAAGRRLRPELGEAVDCIRRLVRGLRLAEQRTRTETGLSAAQLFLLSQLAESGEGSLGDLAERTLTDRSSVAAVVERLEAARFVATSRDSDDRRRVVVRLTPQGQRTLTAAPAAPTELLLAALERMPPAAVRELCTAVARLTDEMGLQRTAPGMLFEERPVRTRRRA